MSYFNIAIFSHIFWGNYLNIYILIYIIKNQIHLKLFELKKYKKIHGLEEKEQTGPERS